MKVLDCITRRRARRFRFRLGIALLTALSASGTGFILATASPPSCILADHEVEAFALKWFDQMQTGRIDRAKLTADYSAHLTEVAVHEMSSYLNQHKYGAAPTRAEVLRSRTLGEQTFYLVQLVFPRGDSASLLFGFNAEGKITGVSLLSMAGD